MVFHACKVNSDADVTIRCSDTDVLIILLANMKNVSENIQMWMEVGVGNYHRFINISKLYEALGDDLSSDLPAFHELTGCDYNPSSFRRGKSRPFKTLKNSTEHINNFVKMTTVLDNTEEIFSNLEKFICEM